MASTRRERRDRERVDALAAGRDRVVDLARAVSILAVAVGHWLVVDLRRAPAGGLEAGDVLAGLPALQVLTWVFQVMPVFFFAGGVVGFPSWERHREGGGTAPAWVAARLWRLAWPTLPVIAFWTVVTQLGRHLLDLAPSVLDATRGIALVIWFLAIFAVTTALIPLMAWAARRVGLWLPAGLLLAAVAVDVASFLTGYRSSSTPAWPWVNYLLVWAGVTAAGRWWPPRPGPAHGRRGLLAAGGALLLLVAATTLGPYPVSMVGVTGQERSNSLPPTIALALLAAVQVGGLVSAREALARWLRRPRVYVAVAALGARTMSVYLWHLLAVAILAFGAVLPGLWPTPPLGSPGWWAAKVAWVLLAALLTVPVVLVAGRWERPPSAALREGTGSVAAAAALLVLGWAALAIQGFHPPALPAGLPLLTLLPLAAATLLLVRGRARAAPRPRPSGLRADRPGFTGFPRPSGRIR